MESNREGLVTSGVGWARIFIIQANLGVVARWYRILDVPCRNQAEPDENCSDAAEKHFFENDGVSVMFFHRSSFLRMI